MRDEKKLLLERVQRKDQSLAGFRQIRKLRLEHRHVLIPEAHHIAGAVDRAPRGVDDDDVTRHGLKPINDLG